MSKRFKLRISKFIPSFQSCRSKDPSTFPQHPLPIFFKISPTSSDEIATVDSLPTPPHSTKQHTNRRRSSFNRQVSSAFSSFSSCGFSSKSASRGSNRRRDQSLEFEWEKEEQWHVVAKIYDVESPRRKIYNSSVSEYSDDEDRSNMILPQLLPLPLPASERRKKQRVKKNKKKRYSKFKHRMSISSADSGLFSSSSFDEREEDEEEETETLVSSSRSFSTDSSTDFNPQLETIRESSSLPRRHKNNHRNKSKKQTYKHNHAPKIGMALCRRPSSVTSPECASPARLSVFKKLIPGNVVEGKVKESFAVVKKSEDPLDDFKKSMMEMIVEKEMFEERDLEELLQCFLSLNSRYHHGVIVEAFEEIWDTIFGTARN